MPSSLRCPEEPALLAELAALLKSTSGRPVEADPADELLRLLSELDDPSEALTREIEARRHFLALASPLTHVQTLSSEDLALRELSDLSVCGGGPRSESPNTLLCRLVAEQSTGEAGVADAVAADAELLKHTSTTAEAEQTALQLPLPVEDGAPAVASAAADSAPLREQLLAAKRNAVLLKRAGDLPAAREALRRVKELQAMMENTGPVESA